MHAGDLVAADGNARHLPVGDVDRHRAVVDDIGASMGLAAGQPQDEGGDGSQRYLHGATVPSVPAATAGVTLLPNESFGSISAMDLRRISVPWRVKWSA